MGATDPDAIAILRSLEDYDLHTAVRAATVPVRCINSDMYPTDIEANRRIWPGFDAVVMKGAGHYPMLERPDEFNNHVRRLVASLSR